MIFFVSLRYDYAVVYVAMPRYIRAVTPALLPIAMLLICWRRFTRYARL